MGKLRDIGEDTFHSSSRWIKEFEGNQGYLGSDYQFDPAEILVFYPLYPPEGGLWVPDSELAFSFRIIFLPPEPSPSLSGEGWGGVKILGYLDRE